MKATWFAQWFCDLMNEIDPEVHADEYCCEWVAPYGFAPEEGCPRHAPN